MSDPPTTLLRLVASNVEDAAASVELVEELRIAPS
jgi:hypothetical protein